jgi:superfamily II RNA helicase
MSLHININESPPLTIEEQEILRFPYELDSFQRHSVHALCKGQHVLVTAHTGCGKTTVAEYGVAWGISRARKVIYTSPLKALSNQIFGDFQRKYPHWEVGIKTGDLDFKSEEAQVLIMTTEILRNMLHQEDPRLDEVCVVIFDEAHYIKDVDRGRIWEESLVLMPSHIQMILLSATLPDAVEFGTWLARCKNHDVVYTTTDKRVVPLTHYFMIDHDQLEPIMDNDGNFDSRKYLQAVKDFQQQHFEPHYLNQWLLGIPKPALFFCFSKRKCEEYAKQITTRLVESKTSMQIGHDFDQLLRNFDKSLVSLRETEQLRSLVIKGVCYHHAGLLSPHKEIIQELFSRGLIRMLFVTETFSAGVNMPAKTVVFTGFSKITNDGKFRTLYTEEYFQMAGRAGRRGMDSKGTVIHLPFNTRDVLSLDEAKTMMTGRIKPIESHLRIDYNFLFKALGRGSILPILSKSLHCSQITRKKKCDQDRLPFLQGELESIQKMLRCQLNKEPLLEQWRYQHSLAEEYLLNNKAKKKYDKTIRPLLQNNVFFDEYCTYFKKRSDIEKAIKDINDIAEAETLYRYEISDLLRSLCDMNYISVDALTQLESTGELGSGIELPLKGVMASLVNETNPIMMVELVMSEIEFDSPRHIITFLSVFLDMGESSDDNRDMLTDPKASSLYQAIKQYRYLGSNNKDWDISTYMMDLVWYWLDPYSTLDAIQANIGTNMYAGEFVRTMLKLDNICRETLTIAAIAQRSNICKLLEDHTHHIVKSIVSPQSLYVKDYKLSPI